MDLSSSAGEFSDELTRQLITASHTGNALVSPLSLLTALSMLLVGSNGSTRTSLSSALKLPSNASQETIDSFYHKLISAYERRSNSDNKLVMSNKVLVAQDYVKHSPLLPSFEAAVCDKYHATIEPADFVNDGLAVQDRVNAWINKNSDGLMKSLLDEPPPIDTVFMLLNSLFFDSKWAKPFNKGYERKFYSKEGDGKMTTFMDVRTRLKYLKIPLGTTGDDIQVVEVPYEREASMVFLFPPESISVNSLFDQKLVYKMSRQVVTKGARRPIDLHIPKFKFDTKLDMKECLRSMGSGDLFLSPDLSGINGAKNIKVSDVKHAAVIEVNENRTRAVGSSWIGFVLQSYPPRSVEWLSLLLNRPFAFVIYDTAHHLPMFVGKLADPAAP